MSARARIEASRVAAKAWLDTMRLPGLGGATFRFSQSHDPEAWPGMVLPASYDAIHCLTLLGARPEPDDTLAALGPYQAEGGAFRLPGMKPEHTYKRDDPEYTKEYIDFHITNYAMGALRSLGRREPRRLAFMDAYLTEEGLMSWIASRCWDDPWMEGNAFVNLGSFLIALAEDGDERAARRLDDLMVWLDAHIDPATGLWGEGLDSRHGLLVGLAGAMHIYHLYWYLERDLPCLNRIADLSISLAGKELAGITSACLDVDIVDVLANCHRLGHRQAEIKDLLSRKLEDILAFQTHDGGFADEPADPEGKRLLRFDGWIGGYSEPQGRSNCFATWFRMAAIGIADTILDPTAARPWTFRTTIGIGYFKNKKRYR